MNSPSVGFVGWNPFQLIHIKPLISMLPGSAFVLEDRGNNISEFDPQLLSDVGTPILTCKKGSVPKLDGVFDILVFQTPFNKLHLIRMSRVAMIQYGYAKEAHNYGPWRTFADLNLTYGDYASQRISPYSPAVTVGHPRYDVWSDPVWRTKQRKLLSAKLNPALKTVLYAPTWGDLSSVDTYIEQIQQLSNSYNVILKLHHNTDILEKGRARQVNKRNIHTFGSNEDLLGLLTVADVFISDYSGAIFDAILCEVPVVLLDLAETTVLGNKVDSYSLEFARRNELGLRVASPAALLPEVEKAISSKDEELNRVKLLRQTLFNDAPGACGRAVEALKGLYAGRFHLSQSHCYIRREMAALYKTRLDLASAKKLIGNS